MMSVYPEQSRERDRWVLSRRSQRNPVDPRRPHAFLVEEERAESGEIVSVATIFLTNRECPWRCLMCDLWKHTLTETLPVGAVPAQIDCALDQCRAGVPPAPNPGKTWAFNRLLTASKGEGRRDACPTLRQIKLYNSGSFFDPRAIPPEDYVAVASRVRAFERVIVECHPALVGESALEFRDLLNAVDASEASPPVHRPTPGPFQEGNSVEPLAGRLPSSHGDAGRIAGPISHHSSMESSLVVGHATKLEEAMGLETAHPQVLE